MKVNITIKYFKQILCLDLKISECENRLMKNKKNIKNFFYTLFWI